MDDATFVDDDDFMRYACGRVANNKRGSYLTMLSLDGLVFGIINIIGNFGTVFVDQSYWQSAIAWKSTASRRWRGGRRAVKFCRRAVKF